MKSGIFLTRLYFVVVAVVTLFVSIFALGDLLSMGLKTYVFPSANVPTYLENCSLDSINRGKILEPDLEVSEEKLIESCEKRNLQEIENHKITQASEAVLSLSIILLTIPLFLMHFKFVYMDWKRENK